MNAFGGFCVASRAVDGARITLPIVGVARDTAEALLLVRDTAFETFPYNEGYTDIAYDVMMLPDDLRTRLVKGEDNETAV